MGFTSSNSVPATCRKFRGQFWDVSIKKMITWYAFGYRVATHHPGHICYGSSTAQRSDRMVLHMSSRSTSCWSMLSHRVHLVVPWICKTQTHISYGVRNWGEHLEDASHVIDDTDSDESVLVEWYPTILLGTSYNIIMII
jgi:hypothetical protein